MAHASTRNRTRLSAVVLLLLVAITGALTLPIHAVTPAPSTSEHQTAGKPHADATPPSRQDSRLIATTPLPRVHGPAEVVALNPQPPTDLVVARIGHRPQVSPILLAARTSTSGDRAPPSRHQ